VESLLEYSEAIPYLQLQLAIIPSKCEAMH